MLAKSVFAFLNKSLMFRHDKSRCEHQVFIIFRPHNFLPLPRNLWLGKFAVENLQMEENNFFFQS